MPLDKYPFYPESGKYLAFLGRTSPEKGLDQAIEIATRVNMPLKIAAKVDHADSEYFETVIKPLLDHPLIEFIGEIGYPEKMDFLGHAAALLFPINWPEPFGIVMMEAIACGTPVIAYPFGSVPEVIENGVTGCIVPGVHGAIEALRDIETFDRERCRQRFEERFTAARMTQDYLSIYERLVSAKTEPLAVSEGVLNWMKLTSSSSTT
jgi:glycosyltransferase involved in cell wall biosynthesis